MSDREHQRDDQDPPALRQSADGPRVAGGDLTDRSMHSAAGRDYYDSRTVAGRDVYQIGQSGAPVQAIPERKSVRALPVPGSADLGVLSLLGFIGAIASIVGLVPDGWWKPPLLVAFVLFALIATPIWFLRLRLVRHGFVSLSYKGWLADRGLELDPKGGIHLTRIFAVCPDCATHGRTSHMSLAPSDDGLDFICERNAKHQRAFDHVALGTLDAGR